MFPRTKGQITVLEYNNEIVINSRFLLIRIFFPTFHKRTPGRFTSTSNTLYQDKAAIRELYMNSQKNSFTYPTGSFPYYRIRKIYQLITIITNIGASLFYDLS